MNRRVGPAFAASIALLATMLPWRSEAQLTPANVVMMARQGVSEAAILTAIRANGVLGPLSPERIIELYRAGVRVPVLEAMMKAANHPADRAGTGERPRAEGRSVAAPEARDSSRRADAEIEGERRRRREARIAAEERARRLDEEEDRRSAERRRRREAELRAEERH